MVLAFSVKYLTKPDILFNWHHNWLFSSKFWPRCVYYVTIIIQLTSQLTFFLKNLASMCLLRNNDFAFDRWRSEKVRYFSGWMSSCFGNTVNKYLQTFTKKNFKNGITAKSLYLMHCFIRRADRSHSRADLSETLIRAWHMSDDECEHYGHWMVYIINATLNDPFKSVLGNNQSKCRKYRIREWFLTNFAE